MRRIKGMIPVLLATLLTIPPATPGLSQNSVGAASSPAGVRLVWSEGADIIRTAVVDPAGTVGNPVRIDAADGANALSPHVACNDRECLAVWIEASTRVVGRFLGDDAQPFTIADRTPVAVDDVGVAWSGTNYVVAWSGSPNGGASGGAAHVNESGVVIPLNVAGGLLASWAGVDVASIPNDAVIVWTKRLDFGPGQTTTTVELSRASDPKTTFEIAIVQTVDIGNAGLLYLRDPRISCSSERCVLTWTKQNGPGRGSETHFEDFSTTLADVPSIIDEFRSRRPILVSFSASVLFVRSAPLWDGSVFRVDSAVYGLEERILTDDASGPAVSIAAWGYQETRSLASAALTPQSHLVAYTKNPLFNSGTELFVWLVDNGIPRRRAARR